MIQEQGSKKAKSYCKKNSPDVSTTSNFLKVSFISNKKKHSTGALCMVECESDTTTPTSTGGSGTATSTTTSTATTTSIDCLTHPGKYVEGYPDKNIGSGGKNSLQECADWCQNKDGCKAYTFQMDWKQCWLMPTDEDFRCPSAGCSGSPWISGTLNCGTTQSQ